MTWFGKVKKEQYKSSLLQVFAFMAESNEQFLTKTKRKSEKGNLVMMAFVKPSKYKIFSVIQFQRTIVQNFISRCNSF